MSRAISEQAKQMILDLSDKGMKPAEILQTIKPRVKGMTIQRVNYVVYTVKPKLEKTARAKSAKERVSESKTSASSDANETLEIVRTIANSKAKGLNNDDRIEVIRKLVK